MIGSISFIDFDALYDDLILYSLLDPNITLVYSKSRLNLLSKSDSQTILLEEFLNWLLSENQFPRTNQCK